MLKPSNRMKSALSSIAGANNQMEQEIGQASLRNMARRIANQYQIESDAEIQSKNRSASRTNAWINAGANVLGAGLTAGIGAMNNSSSNAPLWGEYEGQTLGGNFYGDTQFASPGIDWNKASGYVSSSPSFPSYSAPIDYSATSTPSTFSYGSSYFK